MLMLDRCNLDYEISGICRKGPWCRNGLRLVLTFFALVRKTQLIYIILHACGFHQYYNLTQQRANLSRIALILHLGLLQVLPNDE